MKFNKGILFILLGASFFGFTPIFAKIGFSHGYTLGQINIVHMMVSFVLLWGFTLIKRASFKGLHVKNILQIMATGCLIGLTSIFYYGSMQYLPASLAIILMFQFVWIGIILEWIFMNIKPARITVFSIVLILIGVFFASNFIGGEIQGLPIKGLVFGILSAFTYAGFIFCSGKVAVKVDAWTRSSIMVSGSAILVLVLFMGEIPTVLPLEKDLFASAAGVSLFGAVLPPLFYAAGAPLVSGGVANILTSVELPIAILSASLFLSESVALYQWFGIGIILGAIALNELGPNWIRKRRQNRAPSRE
ncbi:EamA family transporter [Planococcus ruber]|uniref:EamA family transporter n=1 Tax=Planococcus ruber TaxID=2027871 RepID=UPI001FF0144D|nr:DMT family transporter [Planococcus ruber]MCJ1909055.1 DMT family transporter [Planococcus ruber]